MFTATAAAAENGREMVGAARDESSNPLTNLHFAATTRFRLSLRRKFLSPSRFSPRHSQLDPNYAQEANR
jgi:hypothetical protein